MGRTFGSSSRKNLSSTNTTPGPGSYRLPSDFGYYESAKSKSSSTSQMKKPEPQAQDS